MKPFKIQNKKTKEVIIILNIQHPFLLGVYRGIPKGFPKINEEKINDFIEISIGEVFDNYKFCGWVD